MRFTGSQERKGNFNRPACQFGDCFILLKQNSVHPLESDLNSWLGHSFPVLFLYYLTWVSVSSYLNRKQFIPHRHFTNDSSFSRRPFLYLTFQFHPISPLIQQILQILTVPLLYARLCTKFPQQKREVLWCQELSLMGSKQFMSTQANTWTLTGREHKGTYWDDNNGLWHD